MRQRILQRKPCILSI